MHMADSYGDGWSGNVWTWVDPSGTVADATGTLSSGGSGTAALCIPAGLTCMEFSLVSPGASSWPGEVSWYIVDDAAGTTMLSGGSPFSAAPVGPCPPPPTPAPSIATWTQPPTTAAPTCYTVRGCGVGTPRLHLDHTSLFSRNVQSRPLLPISPMYVPITVEHGRLLWRRLARPNLVLGGLERHRSQWYPCNGQQWHGPALLSRWFGLHDVFRELGMFALGENCTSRGASAPADR